MQNGKAETEEREVFHVYLVEGGGIFVSPTPIEEEDEPQAPLVDREAPETDQTPATRTDDNTLDSDTQDEQWPGRPPIHIVGGQPLIKPRNIRYEFHPDQVIRLHRPMSE